MKIAVIGNAGSGKTTVALHLHTLLRIPLFHLDQYCWERGWKKRDVDLFQTMHDQLCNQDHWIIEGCAARMFEYRAQQADIIIFLDVSPVTALYRIYVRSWQMLGKVRESSAPGCPDRFPDWSFLRYIITFNKRRKPLIEKILAQYSASKLVFTLKTTSDREQCYSIVSNMLHNKQK